MPLEMMACQLNAFPPEGLGVKVLEIVHVAGLAHEVLLLQTAAGRNMPKPVARRAK